MITFVYCCLLIVFCQTTLIGCKDYTNDSLDILPKKEVARHKIGSDIVMRCGDQRIEKNNLTWEFRHCGSSFSRGIQCDEYDNNVWKKLDFGKGKRKLEIRNSTKQNAGLYRCLYQDCVIITYIIDIVVPAWHRSPPPEVLSLVASNSTILPNEQLVMTCKTASVRRPEIRWFRECSGRKCDVPKNNRCFCSIPSNPSNSVQFIGDDLYLSKLNIHNARSVDGGLYACVAITLYGEDYKNVTIKVQGVEEVVKKSFSLLFLIPLSFILVPVTVWLCYYRKKKKHVKLMVNDQQQQFIKPVVQLAILLDEDEIV